MSKGGEERTFYGLSGLGDLITTCYSKLSRNYTFGSLISDGYSIYKAKKKILGICLGFQQIVFSEGAKIVQQKNILHGYQSPIKIVGNKSIFKKNLEFLGGRYHSLKMAEPFLSKSMFITMRCEKTNVAMAVEDDINQVYGFQFHPDSFLTPNGKYLIKKVISR